LEILSDFDLRLEPSRILRALGVSPKGEKRYLDILEGLIPRARELIEPVLLYDLFPVEEVRQEEVVIRGGVVRSRRLARLWGRAQEVALALSTLGPQLDEQVSAYFASGKPVVACALDAVGNVALGEMSEKFCRLMEKRARGRGVETSAPFSPGNVDWKLEGQSLFFALLPTEEIGVQLNESYLMVPLKSVSKAVALGRNLHPAARMPPCEYCSLAKRCRYRREKEPLPK